MTTLMQSIGRFVSDEEGVTAIEYGLIAALIAVAIITAVMAVSGSLSGAFNNISGEVSKAAPAPK